MLSRAMVVEAGNGSVVETPGWVDASQVAVAIVSEPPQVGQSGQKRKNNPPVKAAKKKKAASAVNDSFEWTKDATEVMICFVCCVDILYSRFPFLWAC